jgi:hypothetical protein
MLATLEPRDLKVGDALFFHSNTPIGKAIRYLDGGRHNHVGTWDGRQIVEMIDSGLVQRYLEESVDENDVYVDVSRFVGNRDDYYNTQLGSPDYPLEPIIDSIWKTVHNAPAYEYKSLLELALICEARRITNGGLDIREKLDAEISEPLDFLLEYSGAIPLIDSIFGKSGKEHRICSENHGRIFADAGEKYQLVVLSESLHTAYMNVGQAQSKILAHYAELKHQSGGVNLDMFSVHDCYMSPSQLWIGRLKFGNLNTTDLIE